mmetsp:Transcript_14828/g.60577  ORF Transcript_14828/g.60577 Transcript_14828/m.60577 type:complete len:266 (-) Transcript_14828:538-1335(-)
MPLLLEKIIVDVLDATELRDDLVVRLYRGLTDLFGESDTIRSAFRDEVRELLAVVPKSRAGGPREVKVVIRRPAAHLRRVQDQRHRRRHQGVGDGVVGQHLLEQRLARAGAHEVHRVGRDSHPGFSRRRQRVGQRGRRRALHRHPRGRLQEQPAHDELLVVVRAHGRESVVEVGPDPAANAGGFVAGQMRDQRHRAMEQRERVPQTLRIRPRLLPQHRDPAAVRVDVVPGVHLLDDARHPDVQLRLLRRGQGRHQRLLPFDGRGV